MAVNDIIKLASASLDDILQASACDCDEQTVNAAEECVGGDCVQAAETGLELAKDSPLMADPEPKRELDEDPGENLTEFMPEYDDANDEVNNRVDEEDRVGFLAPVSAAKPRHKVRAKWLRKQASPFAEVGYDGHEATLSFRSRQTGKRYLLNGITERSAAKFEKHNGAGSGRMALAALKEDLQRYRLSKRTDFLLASQHVVVDWPR